ncbi:MAG: cardiolipin synthase [Clostridia bacterium]|nr:cardiolipin synthase [Clostridia bacterium]
MKFLRLIFSRFFLSAILFLSQIALIWGFLTVFQFRYLPFQVVWSLISVVMVVIIVNRRETPEYKLPWLFLVMFFPLFGTLLFILYAHPGMKPRDKRALAAVHHKIDPFVAHDPAKEEAIKEFLGKRQGLETYLSSTAHLSGDLSSRVTYLPDGESFLEQLLADLERAESFIFLEYFIISPGKMWDAIHEVLIKKVNEGVEVRILYDDIGSATKLPANFYKTLRREGIGCYKFNPFRPFVTNIFNNRDHRKIAVIDGKVGYTGGHNFGDEYINEDHRLGYWKDTGLRIEGGAVKNLTVLFLSSYDMTAKQLSDYGKYLSVPVESFEGEGYVHPFGDGPKPYYAEQIGKGNFINLIGQAKKYVYITTPYLIMDYSLTEALRNAAMRGVEVRIFTPGIPDKKLVYSMTRASYPFLLESGVRIFEFTPGFLHAKMLVTDDEAAFVGTINFDYRSLTHHYECGALLCKTPCIKEIKKDFEKIKEASEEVFLKSKKTTKAGRIVTAVFQMFAPLL